eukprot:5150073-Amphidinium_carterae.1
MTTLFPPLRSHQGKCLCPPRMLACGSGSEAHQPSPEPQCDSITLVRRLCSRTPVGSEPSIQTFRVELTDHTQILQVRKIIANNLKINLKRIRVGHYPPIDDEYLQDDYHPVKDETFVLVVLNAMGRPPQLPAHHADRVDGSRSSRSRSPCRDSEAAAHPEHGVDPDPGDTQLALAVAPPSRRTPLSRPQFPPACTVISQQPRHGSRHTLHRNEAEQLRDELDDRIQQVRTIMDALPRLLSRALLYGGTIQSPLRTGGAQNGSQRVQRGAIEEAAYAKLLVDLQATPQGLMIEHAFASHILRGDSKATRAIFQGQTPEQRMRAFAAALARAGCSNYHKGILHAADALAGKTPAINIVDPDSATPAQTQEPPAQSDPYLMSPEQQPAKRGRPAKVKQQADAARPLLQPTQPVAAAPSEALDEVVRRLKFLEEWAHGVDFTLGVNKDSLPSSSTSPSERIQKLEHQFEHLQQTKMDIASSSHARLAAQEADLADETGRNNLKIDVQKLWSLYHRLQRGMMDKGVLFPEKPVAEAPVSEGHTPPPPPGLPAPTFPPFAPASVEPDAASKRQLQQDRISIAQLAQLLHALQQHVQGQHQAMESIWQWTRQIASKVQDVLPVVPVVGQLLARQSLAPLQFGHLGLMQAGSVSPPLQPTQFLKPPSIVLPPTSMYSTMGAGLGTGS